MAPGKSGRQTINYKWKAVVMKNVMPVLSPYRVKRLTGLRLSVSPPFVRSADAHLFGHKVVTQARDYASRVDGLITDRLSQWWRKSGEAFKQCFNDELEEKSLTTSRINSFIVAADRKYRRLSE